MRDFVLSIWNAEPVRVAGAITAAWGGLVAADQAMDTFTIPVFVYVVAAAVTPAVTALVRGRVTPV